MVKRILLTLLAAGGVAAAASAQWVSNPSVPTDYMRLTKTYTESGNPAVLTLSIDFPEAYAPYSGQVNDWLVRLADKAFIPGYSFGGVSSDYKALGEFVAKKYFRFAASEIKHDSIVPSPYSYSYSMLVNTDAPSFITYQLSSGLQFGDRYTMTGRQLVTYIYGSGEATNDHLFKSDKFKTVKQALLQSAYSDASFMQSALVQGQGVTKPEKLRALFSPGGDNGWDGMLLPPAALTAQGVVFSFSPSTITADGKKWYHFTVSYSALVKCFTQEAQEAVNVAYPGVLVKQK